MCRPRCAILVSILVILLAGTCLARGEEENVVRLEFPQSPSLVDSIVCGIQRLASTLSDSFRYFALSVRRFSEARHRFYSNIWRKVLSNGSPFGNAGATEPTSIPEPPAIPLLKIELRAVMEHILRRYFSSPVAEAPACRDVMKAELRALEDTAISHFNVYCQIDIPDMGKFCNFFKRDNKRAVALVFGALHVDTIRVVARHAGRWTGCAAEWEARVKQILQSTQAGLPNSGRKPEMFSRSLDELCHSPTSVLALRACWLLKYHGGGLAEVHPQPFRYRRAMIFRSFTRCPHRHETVSMVFTSGSGPRLFFHLAVDEYLNEEMEGRPRSLSLELAGKLHEEMGDVGRYTPVGIVRQEDVEKTASI